MDDPATPRLRATFRFTVEVEVDPDLARLHYETRNHQIEASARSTSASIGDALDKLVDAFRSHAPIAGDADADIDTDTDTDTGDEPSEPPVYPGPGPATGG